MTLGNALLILWLPDSLPYADLPHARLRLGPGILLERLIPPLPIPLVQQGWKKGQRSIRLQPSPATGDTVECLQPISNRQTRS